MRPRVPPKTWVTNGPRLASVPRRGGCRVSRYFCKAMQTVMTTQKTNSDAMYELHHPAPRMCRMCPH